MSPQVRGDRVLVPGGTTVVGNDHYYAEERPLREVTLDDLWFDRYPVTNAEFAAFVEETGHVTVAEVAPDPVDFPGADPALLVAGSQVFTQTPGPVRLDDWTQWWRWQPGASWRAPQGSGQPLAGHPRPPGRPRRLVGRDGVRALERPGPADRDGVGVRRSRRPAGPRLRLG